MVRRHEKYVLLQAKPSQLRFDLYYAFYREGDSPSCIHHLVAAAEFDRRDGRPVG